MLFYPKTSFACLQGWCLLGVAQRTHFICWEGATASQGAFVQELAPVETGLLQGPARCLLSNILPVDPHSMQASLNYQDFVQNLALPFTQSDADGRHSNMKRIVLSERKKASMVTDSSGIDDEVVEAAIRSISMADYNKNVLITSPTESFTRPVTNYSHREKSVRLLRKCPAWTQLDDTDENRRRLGGQGVLLRPAFSAS
jgi:hypothetical protein